MRLIDQLLRQKNNKLEQISIEPIRMKHKEKDRKKITRASETISSGVIYV